jgi:threonine/homoserine/homoserine lactone efflux protein
MVSPGPCFALVVRNSMKYGIKSGLWTALGMVVCDAIFIFLAVIGVAQFLSLYPKVLNAGKMIGGAYIFYIGVEIFLATFKKIECDKENSTIDLENKPKKLFAKGFLTDASNPLLIVGMLAIVLGFMDLEGSKVTLTIYSILIPITTIYVNTIVAICFGNSIIRKIIIPYMHWFERFAGVIICVLAVLMIIE